MNTQQAAEYLFRQACGTKNGFPYAVIENSQRTEKWATELDIKSPVMVLAAYRAAAGRLHPDRGGDRFLWEQVCVAYERLVT